jgi:hypothetical protein
MEAMRSSESLQTSIRLHSVKSQKNFKLRRNFTSCPQVYMEVTQDSRHWNRGRCSYGQREAWSEVQPEGEKEIWLIQEPARGKVTAKKRRQAGKGVDLRCFLLSGRAVRLLGLKQKYSRWRDVSVGSLGRERWMLSGHCFVLDIDEYIRNLFISSGMKLKRRYLVCICIWGWNVVTEWNKAHCGRFLSSVSVMLTLKNIGEYFQATANSVIWYTCSGGFSPTTLTVKRVNIFLIFFSKTHV